MTGIIQQILDVFSDLTLFQKVLGIGVVVALIYFGSNKSKKKGS